MMCFQALSSSVPSFGGVPVSLRSISSLSHSATVATAWGHAPLRIPTVSRNFKVRTKRNNNYWEKRVASPVAGGYTLPYRTLPKSTLPYRKTAPNTTGFLSYWSILLSRKVTHRAHCDPIKRTRSICVITAASHTALNIFVL